MLADRHSVETLTLTSCIFKIRFYREIAFVLLYVHKGSEDQCGLTLIIRVSSLVSLKDKCLDLLAFMLRH